MTTLFSTFATAAVSRVPPAIPDTTLDTMPSYQDSVSDGSQDYAPLNISGWGDQPANGNSIAAWHTLADPSSKIKPGEIGTGNLHRKGANYKPLADEAILEQRLKHQQPIRIDEPSKEVPAPPKQKKIPTAERSQVFASRQAAGAWGSGQLLSVPFWEASSQPATTISTPATTTTTSSRSSTSASSAPSPSARAQPLVRFNIKLAEGINITFSIHEGDDPAAATDRFIAEHHLQVSTEARHSIIRTVTMLYEAKVEAINSN